MYKSTNKGLNWELITRDLPVTQVYSIAIDADDEDLIGSVKETGSCIDRKWWGNLGCLWSRHIPNHRRWYRTLMQTDMGLFAATNNGLWFSDDQVKTCK